jgi:hypothetical protein
MSKLRYLTLALITGLLAVSANASANPPAATISFAGTARLLSNPGPVEVTVHYSCPPPSPGTVLAALVENGVGGSSPAVPATCDGNNHSVTLTVAGSFTPGTATGRAVVFNPILFPLKDTYETVPIK